MPLDLLGIYRSRRARGFYLDADLVHLDPHLIHNCVKANGGNSLPGVGGSPLGVSSGYSGDLSFAIVTFLRSSIASPYATVILFLIVAVLGGGHNDVPAR